MENIIKQNEKVNGVEDKKLAFGSNTKQVKQPELKIVDNSSNNNKSLLETTLIEGKNSNELDPFTDIQLPVKKATKKEIDKTNKKVVKPELTEEEKIQKLVQANLVIAKARQATKQELDKLNPKKQNGFGPTVESQYLDRKNEDGTSFIDDYRRDSSNIYKWTEDYWKVQNPDDIKEDITNWLKAFHETHVNSKNISSTYQVFYFKMGALDKTPTKELYIPTKCHWLMVDQETGDITAVKPNKAIPLTYQINVVINKAGKYTPTPMQANSLMSKYINSSLPGTGTDSNDFSKQDVVQEFSGYSLTTCTKAQKAMFMLGNGHNGKSVLVELLASINPSSVATRMENIGLYNDNFIGKSLIFATETNKKGFDMEFFKAAVSGDTVELRGIRKEKQSVRMIAKWFVLCNAEFRVDDFSNGFFRRMIIINWNVSFENSKDEVKDLAQRIITEELDILLDWCLIGLSRLIKNKLVFTKCEESDKALFNFKNHADKVRMFSNDFPYEYSEDKSKFTTKEVIYESFLKYADKNGYEKLNATNFWLRFKNVYPKIDEDIKADVRKNGKRIVYLTKTLDVDQSEVEEAFQ